MIRGRINLFENLSYFMLEFGGKGREIFIREIYEREVWRKEIIICLKV